MALQRRDVLALLACGSAGLAGCSELGEGDPEPTATPDPTETRTPTETETPAEPPEMTVDETWAMFQADAGHTGYSADHAGFGGRPGVEWRSDTWGLTTSPVVADGTVYFGTGLRHEHVRAVDAATGEEEWRTGIDGREEDVLAVAEGVVYVGTDRLHALDAESGETLWEDGRDVRAGVAVADGRVFAPSDALDRLRAFNVETGEQLWETGRSSDRLAATAVPAVHDDRVYLSSYENLFVLDAATGEREWRASLGDHSRAAPTVTDELVYVPVGGRLRALETDGGEERWQYPVGFARSSPALVDDTLYVAGRVDDRRRSTVAALDATDGEERWRVELPDAGPGSPVVSEETVYLGTDDGGLYALDAASGDRRWSLRFEWGVGTPALLGDRLVTSVGGRLYALTRRDDPDASPWAGVVDAYRGPDPGTPAYPDSDFYFGTHGYDVETDSAVNTEADAPFELTVDVTGDRIDADEAVTVALSFTNESDDDLTISGGAPAPFEIVRFNERGGTRTLTAWSDAYEDGHVHTTPHRGVVGRNDIGVATTVEPGETVSETYRLSNGTHGIQPGTYSFRDAYNVRRGEGPPRSGDDENWTPGVWVEAELSRPAREEGDVVYDLAITEERDVPEEFVGDFSVDVLQPMTDLHPGLVEITLENDEGALESVASQRRLPFGSYVGLADDGARLVLITEDMFAPGYVERRDDEGGWIPRFRPYVESRRGWGSRRFERDAAFSKRYLVLGYPEDDGPVTAGDYRFEQGFADDDVEFPWGFRLSLRPRG